MLLYYAIAYYEPNGNDIYDIAIRTAKKANIYTGDFDYELQQGIKMTTEIMRNMISLANEKDMEDTKSKRNKCDINDIAARTYIYNSLNPIDPLYTDVNRPIREFDTGAYKNLNFVTKKYAKLYKIKDNFDHDHIPSFASLKTYLENRDQYVINFDNKLRNVIQQNGTVVAINQAMYAAGRTYKGRATSTMIRDSKDLRKATIKDFKMHYYYYKKNGSSNPSFETLFNKAFIQTYQRNKMMCLYVNR